MSGPIFNPDAYRDALTGGSALGLGAAYTKRDWLADNKAIVHAQEQMRTASAPPVAFFVRNIENGHVVVHKGAEYFCEDFEKVAERVVALLAADAMDRTNRPRPGQDDAVDTLRHMQMAYPPTILPSEFVVRITGGI